MRTDDTRLAKNMRPREKTCVPILSQIDMFGKHVVNNIWTTSPARFRLNGLVKLINTCPLVRRSLVVNALCLIVIKLKIECVCNLKPTGHFGIKKHFNMEIYNLLIMLK